MFGEGEQLRPFALLRRYFYQTALPKTILLGKLAGSSLTIQHLLVRAVLRISLVPRAYHSPREANAVQSNSFCRRCLERKHKVACAQTHCRVALVGDAWRIAAVTYRLDRLPVHSSQHA